ncbi:MAG: elongation factor [Solirubrobacterales bacterium]|jgi:elongation factor G|nr:elongation factor [Solirubrobacterales bacterium]
MPHKAADRIRNVALIGHRGSGKTSLHEAMLYEAGAINRLGKVEDGSTVSDHEPDEKARGLSINACVSCFPYAEREINLIDTPGDPSFVADAAAALRAADSAVVVLSGVAGVEVQTERLWQRADEEGLARLVFVNMLDRERADFFAALGSLKAAFGPHVVATEIPIGSEHEVRGVVDLIDMEGFIYAGGERGSAERVPIPDELLPRAEEYREKLMDEVAENSDALMERYLEGEEIAHEEILTALKRGVTEGHLFPLTCGIATANLGTNRLLDALVEDLPSPQMRGPLAALDGAGEAVEIAPDEDGPLVAYVFKTTADPYAGRINIFRIYSGTLRSDSHVVNAGRHQKERIGQIGQPLGKDLKPAPELGAGDIGAVAKLKETRAGDVLCDEQRDLAVRPLDLPAPVMAFSYEPRSKGDEEKAATAVRRLSEEDPTLDVHRDPQTGDQIIAGLTQVHVEVLVARMKERFGAEIELHPPRVPYQETIRQPASARARYKKQTGGKGQFADCAIEIEPGEGGVGLEFVNRIKGAAIPGSFIPAVEKGVIDAMQHGTLAGFPVKGVRVRLVDGKHHDTDSSELAFKLAGAMAFKQAMEAADPVLLEPIVKLTIACPDEVVGDVIGDLNARRGRPLGMEAKGQMSELRAEVPMAEVLDFAPDLRSISGGRAEFTMEFERYEEVPAHLAEKVAGTASAAEISR